jgi:hypothetical protein
MLDQGLTHYTLNFEITRDYDSAQETAHRCSSGSFLPMFSLGLPMTYSLRAI